MIRVIVDLLICVLAQRGKHIQEPEIGRQALSHSLNIRRLIAQRGVSRQLLREDGGTVRHQHKRDRKLGMLRSKAVHGSELCRRTLRVGYFRRGEKITVAAEEHIVHFFSS